eukprot:132593-Rhodomonas_salina.1
MASNAGAITCHAPASLSASSLRRVMPRALRRVLRVEAGGRSAGWRLWVGEGGGRAREEGGGRAREEGGGRGRASSTRAPALSAGPERAEGASARERRWRKRSKEGKRDLEERAQRMRSRREREHEQEEEEERKGVWEGRATLQGPHQSA